MSEPSMTKPGAIDTSTANHPRPDRAGEGAVTQPAIFDRARRRTAVLYGYARGTKNPKNKLSVNDVLSIRTSVEKTEVLAQRYRVDRGTISRIRSRKMWCHV